MPFNKQKHSQTSSYQFEANGNVFNNNVLVGNWFEERFANKIDRKAITPGTYADSQCSQDVSIYKNDFQQPIRKYNTEDHQEFITWRQMAFKNYTQGQQSNIKIWDSDKFAKNLTTFTDIMYRIMPQQDKLKSKEVQLGKKKFNDDYMRSFGNSTKTGLLKWMECENKISRQMPLDVSHYKNNFKPLPVKRIIRHKATQKKTSLL